MRSTVLEEMKSRAGGDREVGALQAPHADLYRLAEIYDAMFSWSLEYEVQYLISLIKKFTSINLRKALLLDIGCGTGRVAGGFRSRGIKVLCLDISSAMCSYARRLRGLDALNADMLALPVREESVDIAYSMLATINHVDGVKALERHLGEVYRVLRIGGIYVAGLVVGLPGCIGICDEWNVRYGGRN